MFYRLTLICLFIAFLSSTSITRSALTGQQEKDKASKQEVEQEEATGNAGEDSKAIESKTEKSATSSFIQLFDGETTIGWTNPYEWGEVEVVDREIRLTADKKFFLVTENTFSNFELLCEVCLPPEGTANSGVMFRCHVEPNRVFGYQAECDPTERAWTGGLYDEGRRAWLFPKDQERGKTKLVQAPKGEWIQYRIVCVGNRLQISINGAVITDFTDDMDASGHIGIQHHGEKGQTYRFRNIQIREIADGEAFPETIFVEGESKVDDSSRDDVTKDKADDKKTAEPKK